MNEEHDPETDAARSRELLAKLSAGERWMVAELMSISFRAGVEEGQRRSMMAAFA